jgi:prolyl-tRNA synthetase
MRYSKLFGKTQKSVPRDATLTSHKLLYQAGFIRESTAGRYYLLPLGLKVHEKIKEIIKEVMDRAGAQEMIAPVLHQKELWKETNRTTSVGFELMSIKDRNEAEFVLGGTAEEMLVDLVRKFQVSYKDLPFNLYQFSTKFRDEMRARGGLLRLREFVMKDAYSFDVSEKEFKKEYAKMRNAYRRIFERLGLETVVVESDNGYIGGEYCHEFVVESVVGESKFLQTSDGSYAAHEEVAVFEREVKNVDEKMLPLKEVEAARGTTMEDGVKLHGKPLWQQIKDVLFVDERGRFVLAIIRGDYEVNEIKLMHLVKSYRLRHATDQEIKDKIHSVPGFISPAGIKENLAKEVELIVAADKSLRTIKNAYGGTNKKNKDYLNMNIDRDYKVDVEGDIALAKEGYSTKDGKKLIAKRGIEVGNIFQLGLHYSSRMEGAVFMDEDGAEKQYYMGCYGIGLARSLAAIVEVSHDDRGIVWPEEAAPYQAHLIHLGGDTASSAMGRTQPATSQVSDTRRRAEEVYHKLEEAGIEVLYDDRDMRAGEKFADADLIGIPLRLVVSEKTKDKIEVKRRGEDRVELMTLAELIKVFDKK